MDLLLLLLRLLLAAVLYLFLGAVLYFLWRNLRRSQEVESVAPRRYGQLVVVEVPEEEETQEALPVGATLPLQPVTSLGRSVINTVIIPDVYASAEHALLTYRGGQWWLEDRGSRNGTTLNAAVINGPTVVSAGDIVGIGRVQMKLEIGDAGSGNSHARDS
jgi:hypothetical protein